MTSPDRPNLSLENEELIRSVIKPGELVWGTARDAVFTNTVLQGIQPPFIHQQPQVTTHRYESICFALLGAIPEKSGLQLYYHAQHLGPIHNESSGYAVIVSREAILRDFPHCVRATGKEFISPRYRDQYAYNATNSSVFSIPIDTHSGDMEPFVNEVEIRYNPRVRYTPCITPEYWTGVIIRPDMQSTARSILQQHNFNVPIFSPSV